jgi:hypothetical protein
MPTLTVDEILQDTMDAFKVRVPGLNNMSTDFRGSSLKLNKTYTGHIAAVPSVTSYDAGSGGYQNGATDIRTLLTDVDVTVDQHPKVSLSAAHLNQIADDKRNYDKVIANMGFALAKNMVSHIVSKFTSREISQSSTYTTGNSDYDAIENIRSDMNAVAASPVGRVGIVNTAVASALHIDERVLSADYRGQMDGGNAYRVFQNLAGFESVSEWPELGTNNGTAIAITGVHATDIITTASAHNLLVGDRVIFPTLTGGTGLTAASVIYFVETVGSATTLKVSETADGASVNWSSDISGGTIQKVEHLSGMFWEPRAIALVAGIPDDLDGAAQLFGAPPTYGISTLTDADTGLTMAAISESQQGTLKGFLHLTFVYGVSVGRQARTNAAGSLADYAGHRLITL